MNAIVLIKPKTVEHKELEDLVLKKDDDVKIRIKAVGLCGSDINKINSGSYSLCHLKTRVLGHEFSGVIEEVGNKNLSLKVGDRVTGIPLIPCYICPQCEIGNYQTCENLNSIGRTIQGAFAEYIIIPSKNVRKIPKNLTYEEAALTDVVAGGVHAYHLAESPKNKEVLIIGDGAVGITCLEIYKLYGNRVTMVGKHNRNIVRYLNTKFVESFDVDKLRSKNYDIVVEAVGKDQKETITQAIRLAKPSGKIIVIGVFEQGYEGSIPFRDFFYKEIRLVGSNSYSLFKNRNEFDIALQIIKNKQINLPILITNILPLSEFEKGLSLMENKEKSKSIKIIYKP